MQLQAENRVLFRVGGTLGRWGHEQHLQTPQQEGRGEPGLTGLCQQGGRRAEPAPGSCRQPGLHTARALLPARLAPGTGSAATLGTADQSCLALSLCEG